MARNLTIYYSKFALFNDSLKFSFMKYSIFKEKLKQNLGEDWNSYSSQILSDKSTNVYLKSGEVLNAGIEVWLNCRKEARLNKLEQRDFEEFEGFFKEFESKFEGMKKNEALYKAVLQGFFNSANKTWSEMLNSEPPQTLTSFSKKKKKTQSKTIEKMSYLRKKWMNIRNSSNVIQPLIMASTKLTSYFTPSKPSAYDPPSLKDEKLCNSFKETLSFDLQEKLKNLSLNEKTFEKPVFNEKRKGSDEILEIEGFGLKKLSKKEEEHLLSKDFLKPTSKYIEKFMENSMEKWQVARCFVTNMIEVNYNKIYELENKISLKAKDIKNNIRVRLLQPAETFYHHLMKIWLIFNTTTYENEISFNDYLEKVKESMGNTWNERYLEPTKVFFNTLIYEWGLLKEENINEEQNLINLVRKVREDLMKLWEESIVSKIQNI